MHPSNIVAILARVLALKVLMDAVKLVFSLLARSSYVSFGSKAIVVIYLLCAAALWLCSPWIGRVMSRGCSSEVETKPLLLYDLYSLAFVGVGLFYAAGSLGPSLSWLFYALSQSGGESALSQQDKVNYYQFFQCLADLAIGLFLVLKARHLASRLLRYDSTAGTEPPSHVA
jgi:hypothetical protein